MEIKAQDGQVSLADGTVLSVHSGRAEEGDMDAFQFLAKVAR